MTSNYIAEAAEAAEAARKLRRIPTEQLKSSLELLKLIVDDNGPARKAVENELLRREAYTASLDNAATAFHDNPCEATATAYEALAREYAADMMITEAELMNIFHLVLPYLPLREVR